jgi:integrase
MRYPEIRLLRCNQVDLAKRTVRVRKSKTEAGTGRTIPPNTKATEVLKFWAGQFPEATGTLRLRVKALRRG